MIVNRSIVSTFATLTLFTLTAPLVSANQTNSNQTTTQISNATNHTVNASSRSASTTSSAASESSSLTQAQIEKDEDFIYNFFSSLNNIPTQAAYNQNRAKAYRYVTNDWFFTHYFPSLANVKPAYQPPKQKTIAKRIDVTPVKHQPGVYQVKVTAVHYHGNYTANDSKNNRRTQHYTLICHYNHINNHMSVKPAPTKR